MVAVKQDFKKWYRTEAAEVENSTDGVAARKEVVFGRISKTDIVSALQHWANQVTEQGQYIDLQSLDNCPDSLYDCVAVILGNDSG